MGYWPIFVAVFLAELGDKTQLATLLFATDQRLNKFGVFFAASGALLLSTCLAVAIGGQLSDYISTRTMKLVAGVGFLGIGVWILWGLRQ